MTFVSPYDIRVILARPVRIAEHGAMARLIALLIFLAQPSCGSNGSSGAHRIDMGESPERWHCVKIAGPGGARAYHPCYAAEERCIENRSVARANGFEAGECQESNQAFCYLSDATPEGARSCHSAFDACARERRESLEEGRRVTACQRMP